MSDIQILIAVVWIFNILFLWELESIRRELKETRRLLKLVKDKVRGG